MQYVLFLHGCLSGNLAILKEHRIPSEGTKNSFSPWEVMLSATCGIKQKTPHLGSREGSLTKGHRTQLAIFKCNIFSLVNTKIFKS